MPLIRDKDFHKPTLTHIFERNSMKKNVLFTILGAAALLVVILYMSGFFSSDKIKPGLIERTKPPGPLLNLTAKAQIQSITETYEAVGTVRPRTETKIEAQVTGKVRRIRVKPSDAISKGDTLIILDDREFIARLDRARQGLQSSQAAREEARQGVNAARADFVKAELQYNRMQSLFADKVTTSRELEQAEAEFLLAQAKLKQAEEGLQGAEAGVRQAQKLVEEAKITQGYTVIKAPEDAEVVKRLVEPGDLAVPGKPLLIVQTAGSMRLEAYVREGLISQVRPNKELMVRIDALGKTVQGIVEEVEPSADPKTRTFLIKVGLPEVLGAYPGMFGRLLVPAGTRQAVLIPTAAVRRVGQLETVMVKEDQGWGTYSVKTGETHGDRIEVLSGLSGNETVALFGKNNV
jgi:RND family efflux transporter MFP subunit